MERRVFLSVASAGALSGLSGAARGQGARELKLVTSWPKGSIGLGTSAERVARMISEVSGGRLRVKVFGAGELVDAFEVFDAVSAGVADMYHSAEYYWQEKSPAFSFFAAVPFGFTADEMNAWVYRGGGQELWDEVSGSFNVKPFLCANTGVQMGGWYVKEVRSIEDYDGLRYRMPGLGGEVLKRLDAVVVNLPGGQIVPSLKSGAIDAAEWVGPWMDLHFGLYQGAKYYYYPGFHEPGTALSLGVNRRLWESLDPAERSVIRTAAAAENSLSLADFSAENGAALRVLIEQHGVQVRKIDDSVLAKLRAISDEVLAEVGARDAMTKRVYESFLAYRRTMMDWSGLSQQAFLNARSLAAQGKT